LATFQTGEAGRVEKDRGGILGERSAPGLGVAYRRRTALYKYGKTTGESGFRSE
jgi:hypothetical protein